MFSRDIVRIWYWSQLPTPSSFSWQSTTQRTPTSWNLYRNSA